MSENSGPRVLKLGTRGSLLARTQSGHVSRAVTEATGFAVEDVVIRTEGDDTTTSLTKAARPGVFVSALRAALLAGEVDFIVHSFKDLPSKPESDITLAAVPPREDHRDALISQSGTGLFDLPQGAKVGTSSPRRAARIKFLRPDLEVSPIRGNVDSRLAKVKSGEFDATLLAVAGLNRVGLSSEISEILTEEQLLPAPAQGALAIECRSHDIELVSALEKLNDPLTRLITTAERAVLVGISASCSTAIGAFAKFEGDLLTLTCELSDPETNEHERVEKTVSGITYSSLSESYQLGMFAAHALLATPLGIRLSNTSVS
ncbi:MAG: hydroxymethylbilane synthase [Rhodoluna sp.]